MIDPEAVDLSVRIARLNEEARAHDDAARVARAEASDLRERLVVHLVGAICALPHGGSHAERAIPLLARFMDLAIMDASTPKRVAPLTGERQADR